LIESYERNRARHFSVDEGHSIPNDSSAENKLINSVVRPFANITNKVILRVFDKKKNVHRKNNFFVHLDHPKRADQQPRVMQTTSTPKRISQNEERILSA